MIPKIFKTNMIPKILKLNIKNKQKNISNNAIDTI